MRFTVVLVAGGRVRGPAAGGTSATIGVRRALFRAGLMETRDIFRAFTVTFPRRAPRDFVTAKASCVCLRSTQELRAAAAKRRLSRET